MISTYLAIGLGGGLGAVSRALLARALPETLFNLPLPILFINILGCFAIGVLTEFFAQGLNDNQLLKLFLTTGFLGGFTTFSAFSLEFGLLFEKNLYGLAIVYAMASVMISLIGFFAGLRVVKLFF